MVPALGGPQVSKPLGLSTGLIPQSHLSPDTPLFIWSQPSEPLPQVGRLLRGGGAASLGEQGLSRPIRELPGPRSPRTITGDSIPLAGA